MCLQLVTFQRFQCSSGQRWPTQHATTQNDTWSQRWRAIGYLGLPYWWLAPPTALGEMGNYGPTSRPYPERRLATRTAQLGLGAVWRPPRSIGVGRGLAPGTLSSDGRRLAPSTLNWGWAWAGARHAQLGWAPAGNPHGSTRVRRRLAPGTLSSDGRHLAPAPLNQCPATALTAPALASSRPRGTGPGCFPPCNRRVSPQPARGPSLVPAPRWRRL